MKDMIKIQAPLTDKDIKELRAGQDILINGIIYTARDLAHQRMSQILSTGGILPFDVNGQIIYYTGPTPAPPGKIVGAIGPTTSSRLDPFTLPLLARGLKGMIGKGPRNQTVVAALIKNRAVYFSAIGGAGALLAKCILRAETIAFSDLGPEAVRRLLVKNFPVIVAVDCHGGNLYDRPGKPR